jgi:hypothetical protein
MTMSLVILTIDSSVRCFLNYVLPERYVRKAPYKAYLTIA